MSDILLNIYIFCHVYTRMEVFVWTKRRFLWYHFFVVPVGLTWGFRSKQELVEYHADVIVNNPVDILDIVENGIRIS